MGRQMKKSTKRGTSISTKTLQTPFPGVANDPGGLLWAYLAGLFDGEGCVTISYRGRPKPKRVHRHGRASYPYWAVRIVLTNCSFALLRYLRRNFGGYVHQYGWQPKLNDGRRRQNPWIVTNAAHCLWVLNGMLPYLYYKKPEAKLAIKYFSRIQRGASTVLLLKEVNARFRILRAIRSLPGRRRMSGKVARWRMQEYLHSRWRLP